MDKESTERDLKILELKQAARVKEALLSETLKQVEDIRKKVAEAEERFRSVAQTAVDAVISADSRGNVIFWNKSAEKLFGYTEAEMLGRQESIIMPERYRDLHTKGVDRMTKTGERKYIGRTIESFGLKKNGTEFPIELSLSTWDTKDGRFYSAIIRDTTERKQLEQLREDLNHMIVHDLKNPLTGIVSSVEMFLNGMLGPLTAEQKKYMETVQLSARKLNNLISDLLDLAKLEAAHLEVNLVVIKSEAIQKNLSWIEPSAAKEGKKIVWGIEQGLSIKADEKLLIRILENLLSNSIKHTEKGGQITLNIKRTADRILFEVIDNGEGIPAEYLTKVFEKFFKVEHQKLKTKIDTGLGLAFSKMAVEAQGGNLAVESVVGRGSRFFFHLPAA